MTIDELLDEIGISPGPWTPYSETETFAVLHDGDPHRAIVQWNGFDSSNTSIRQQRANVRAIAQTREMLKALIDGLMLIERMAKGGIVGQPTRYAMKKTIESATGKSWSWIKSKLESE